MVDQEHALIGLLARIEATPAGGAGSFVIETGGDLPGIVLVENRRICWAAAPGTRRRLTEIICQQSGADRAAIEAIFVACKQSGRPIGEVLVELGAVTSEQLCDLLMSQTVEALLALLAYPGNQEATWQAHRAGTYQPQFTFSVLDVWSQAVATRRRLDVSAVKPRVRRAAATGFGAIFVDEPGQDPVPAFATGRATLDEVGAVGRWARKALRRSHRATGLGRRDNLFVGPKGCVVAWREADLLCVAADHQEGSWSRIMTESASPAAT